MSQTFIPMSKADFSRAVTELVWPTPKTEIHVHHTWRPNHAQYRGLPTIQAMFDYHTQTNHWSDIAQHVSIGPEGTIWTGRAWGRSPASAAGHNGAHVFMFETIGDFDHGCDPLTGAQFDSVLHIVATLQIRFGLPTDGSIRFHNQMSTKTCPGSSVDRARFVAQVAERRAQLEAGAQETLIAGANSGALAAQIRAAVAGGGADVIGDDAEILHNEALAAFMEARAASSSNESQEVRETDMHPFEQLRDDDLVLDAIPDAVAATIETRNRFMNNLAMGGGDGPALEFLVTDVQRWLPGQTVRVAFLDGDAALHRDIMLTTQEITDACNLSLDFGEDGNGEFRRWTEEDADYAAEIRVSFNKDGYFSLVGTDSVDPQVGAPMGDVGGRAYQASLNLGGFAQQRPPSWRGTVLHEFLHALGFHHSHQNMRGPCQASFRWDDDAGYQPTQNQAGAFVSDSQGRRPGIYTYLSGFPNFWSRDKVDHNLKTEEDPNLVAGPFDPRSVMLYRFPDIFYKTVPSPCAPAGQGQSLSEGDKRGLRLLYPHGEPEVSAVVEAQRGMLDAISRLSGDGGAELEAVSTGATQLGGVAAALRRKLSAL